MDRKQAHHVLPNKKGGWDIKKESSSKISAHFTTRERAIAAARIISQMEGTDLLIHGKGGEIERESY